MMVKLVANRAFSTSWGVNFLGNITTLTSSAFNLDGGRIVGHGTGLLDADKNGALDAGVITSFKSSGYYGGSTLDYTISGLSLSVSDLVGKIDPMFVADLLTGDDTIIGSSGDDYLDGSTGNDKIYGGAGNDWLNDTGGGTDLLSGGAGDDTLQGSGMTNPYGNKVYSNQTLNGGAGMDTLYQLVGATNARTEGSLLGGYDNDKIYLYAGAFSNFSINISGGSGDDRITVVDYNLGGGHYLKGSLSIDGGVGDDTLIFDHQDSPSFFANATVKNIEHLVIGGEYANGATVAFLASFKDIDSRQDGNTQSNPILYINMADGGKVDLSHELVSSFGVTASSAGNTIITGTGDDTLQGGAGVDFLIGGAGNDILYSGRSTGDVLRGGAGDDQLYITKGAARATVDGGAGIDAVGFDFSASSTGVNIDAAKFATSRGVKLADGSIVKNVEAFDIVLGTGDDTFKDNSSIVGNDRVQLYDGINTAWISGGQDDITGGGNGTDTLHIDYSRLGEGIHSDLGEFRGRFVWNVWEGGDYSTSSNRVEAIAIEKFYLTATSHDDVIVSSFNDDVINAGAGDDTLYAAFGADQLDGGDGNDTLSFDFSGFGKIEGALSPIAVSSGAKIDLSSAAAQALPSAMASIDDGSTYSAPGTVVLKNIENIIGTNFDDDLSGSAAANKLVGGGGNDILNGRDGDDVLDGGTGSDTLTGGAGADTFLFSVKWPSNNTDTLTDFVSGTDHFAFSKAAFKGFAGVGALGSGAFWSGAGVTAAHDADDRLIYDTSTGKLWYDADGTGTSKALLVAVLTDHPALALGDILIMA